MPSVRRQIIEWLKTNIEGLNPDPDGTSKLDFTAKKHWVNPFDYWKQLPLVCIARGNEEIDLTLFGQLPSRRFPVTLGLYASYDDESVTEDIEDMLDVIIQFLVSESTAASIRTSFGTCTVLTHIGPIMFDMSGIDRDENTYSDFGDYALMTIPLMFEWTED